MTCKQKLMSRYLQIYRNPHLRNTPKRTNEHSYRPTGLHRELPEQIMDGLHPQDLKLML